MTFDRIPEHVYWYRWTERYGFPYEGTWMDQPRMFFLEIEASRKGLEQRESESESRDKSSLNSILMNILKAVRGIK